MPRRAQSLSLEERALATFNKHFDEAAIQAAASLGRPPQTKQIGDAELVRQWGTMDSTVDRASLSAQLLTTGADPALLDPNSPKQLAIVKAAPDLAPLYAQPVQDPELADILAGFAERPFRYGILSAIDDPEDQVKEAERLSRLHDQKTSAALEAALAEQQGAGTAAPMSAMSSPMSSMSAPAEPGLPAPPSAPSIQAPSQMMGG